MEEKIYTRAIEIVKAKIGLISNNSSIIYNEEYFEGVKHPIVENGEGWQIHSLQANFHIKNIEYNPQELDAYFHVYNYKNIKPIISIKENEVLAIGDWLTLEIKATDKRFSLFGNLGLLFRFTLKLLENKYNIFNFHACALYNEKENKILLALGERGSGKTALLLSAITRSDFKIFATEIVPIELKDDEVIFYKGTLRNNVRIGNLLYDFPEIMEDLKLKFKKIDDPWGTKIQINLEKYAVKEDVIINPEIIIVIPRIEEYNQKCQFNYIKDYNKLKRIFIDNISDRIRSLSIIYDKIPIGEIDNIEATDKRINFVENFLNKAKILKALTLFAGPKNCLDGWL
ncbi:MAG: hypothetical protein QXI49_06215 [Candidatus Methanomethylicaceae archaeon]